MFKTIFKVHLLSLVFLGEFYFEAVFLVAINAKTGLKPVSFFGCH